MRFLVIAAMALVAAAAGSFAVRTGPLPAAQGASALMVAHSAIMARMQETGVAHSGDPDLDFVTQMIPRRQGAIQMGKVLLMYSTNFDVRKFTEGVITAQESEVAQMTLWKEGHATAPASSADAAAIRAAFEAANQKLIAAMGGDHGHGDKVEQAFLAMMLPHHQGAIDMASAAIKYGRDPDIRALAQKMMADQVGEMIEMMEMLAELGHH